MKYNVTSNNKQGHNNNIYNNSNSKNKHKNKEYLLTTTKYDVISNNKQGHINTW